MTKAFVTLAAALLLAACQRGAAPSQPPSGDSPAAPAAAEPPAAVPTPTPPAAAAPKVVLTEQTVAYGETKTTNLVGFLAVPADAIEPLPGLLVIHDWWGLNDDIKAMTRRLAAEGYVALAVDLYDGSVAETPEQAQVLMSRVVSDPQNARANLKQAYQYLDKYALSPKIGSIGWAFGGGWSLQTGLMLPNKLDAVVMYSGQLVSDSSELAKLDMPLLGLFAELDGSVPVHDVQAFRDNLRRLGKPSQVLIYPHVKGGFAMPGARNYDAKAAADAWTATLAFLDQNLKSRPPP